MARKTSAGRNAAGAGSIRKKTVKRNEQEYTYWEARVTVGFDPGTGRQRQKSFTGKTQREVREKMQAAAVAVNAGDYFEPSKMTLARWIEIWLQEYSADKKYSTVKHYKAQCRTHVIPALGAVRLSDLSVPQIQTFYNTLQRKGLAPKSVRNIHGILTKCLSTAAHVGYLRSNPASAVTLPKVIRKEIHPLTDQQVRAFLQAANGDEYGILLKVILFTGLRESEAIGLTWDCIDFKLGTIKVYRQLQKRPLKDGGFTFAPLKNNKTRTLKPAPFVMKLLERRRKEQIAHCLMVGELWEGWKSEEERRNVLVFTSVTGKNLHPQTVYSHYKKLAAEIGALESRAHDLRHTFAVLSLQNGDDVKTVQSNLGHATAAFAPDVYGRGPEGLKAAGVSRMETRLAGRSARHEGKGPVWRIKKELPERRVLTRIITKFKDIVAVKPFCIGLLVKPIQSTPFALIHRKTKRVAVGLLLFGVVLSFAVQVKPLLLGGE